MFTWLAFNTLCALPLCVLALLVRRLPRVSPALEHVLWLLVLVRLVLPPFSSPAAPPPGGASSPAIVSSAPPTLGDELVAGTTRLLGPNWSSWGSQVLLGAFLAVLLFVVVRELLRARAVERCVDRAARAGAELEDHVRHVAGRLGLDSPRLRVSSEASGPFLWSLRRPVLVLPAADDLPAPTVLAHELAHLRRRDHWTAWLELLVQGFHFWNPLFWIARRQLHRAAELACDSWVVQRFPAERRAFAEALVDTAERASLDGFVPRAAQAIGMDRRDFEERLVRILRGGNGPRGGRALLAAGFLCAGLTWPGWVVPSLTDFRQALPELPAGIDHELWRGRLVAAEERLRADPSDGAATMQRGIALLGLGRASESLAAFERQHELGFQPAKALYNQACALVQLGELDAALVCLAHATDLGLDVASLVAVDPDMAALRGHPDLAAR
jgi:beta-lactamase regulating signal transducer with metallopeptidase domain